MAKISKQELENSVLALDEAFLECSNQPPGSKSFKLMRDATILRFVFSTEIAWKNAAKFLGSPATSAKPVLREMLRANLISNIDEWFDYIDARNKSSHTYDEAIAAEVLAQVGPFLAAVKLLLAKL